MNDRLLTKYEVMKLLKSVENTLRNWLKKKNFQ